MQLIDHPHGEAQEPSMELILLIFLLCIIILM